MAPSFNLWRSILGEYVAPARAVEFNAHLARLFTAFGHQWEPEKKPEREVDFTEQERARHAIIRAEIQASWSEEERRKRSDGEDMRARLKSLELAILRGEKESCRVRSSRSEHKPRETYQLEIGYQD